MRNTFNAEVPISPMNGAGAVPIRVICRLAAPLALAALVLFAPSTLAARGATVSEQTVRCLHNHHQHVCSALCGGTDNHAKCRNVPGNLGLTVNFEFDRAELDGEAVSQLSALARRLSDRQWADARLELYGNTDTVGHSHYNDQLSAWRARSVRDWFTANVRSLDSSNIQAMARGESNPIEAPSRDNFRSRTNRRVDIRVLGYDGHTHVDSTCSYVDTHRCCMPGGQCHKGRDHCFQAGDDHHRGHGRY